MKGIFRTITAVSSASVLMVQMVIFPVSVNANETVKILPSMEVDAKVLGAAETPKAPAVTLEQAIQKVKTYFDIAKEYSEFDSGYSSYNNREVWSLNWASKNNEGGSFSAQVDAGSGDVININSWKPYKPDAESTNSKLSVEEAKNKASKLIESLLADRIDNLQFTENENQIIPLKNYGPVQYSFRWQRVYNQLPVIGDEVTVQVNGNDGSISNYNLNWTKGDLQETAGAISPEQALKAFTESSMLELQYYLPSVYKLMASGEKRDVKLVYQLANSSTRGAIDALTGEPLKLPMGQWASSSSVADGMGSNESAKEAPSPLTPEEQREIEENAKYASQEEAIAVVKKLIGISDNLVLRNVSLNRDWQSNERIWFLEWSTEKSEKGIPQYLYARVNAVSKELWGFNLSNPTPGEKKEGGIDRSEAQQIGENFLTRVQPNRFKQVKESEDQKNIIYQKGIPEGSLTGPIQFNYRRIENGVPFPNNNMYVTVDPVSKQVIGYNLYWGEYNFPSPTGVLKMEDAVTSYLKSRSLTLSYLKIYQEGKPETLKLVYLPYSPTGMPNSNLIDAKSGEQLNWQGEPLAADPRPYNFTDISGHKAEQEIARLGRAGAFGEFGTSFDPEEKITLASLLRASLIAQNGPWRYAKLSDEEILKEAKERGWLKEDYKSDQDISREYLAKLMIRVLGLERLASLQGIYHVSFKDGSALNQESIGYVALADALGIFDIESRYFEPVQLVNRAEAALAIVQALD